MLSQTTIQENTKKTQGNVVEIDQDKDMIRFKIEESRDLRVFYHHIYEFKKGLRNLVLATQKKQYQDSIEKKLQKHGISYLIHTVSANKINIYFGHKACIDVVRAFDAQLNKLTPEEDFILGIMLGYDRLKQCDRYIERKEKHNYSM